MLQGKKARLRPKQLSDAPRDYAWSQDQELCQLEATVPIAVPFPDYLRLYSLELSYDSRRCQRFAIEALNGEHIGNCMVYQIDPQNGEAELGILIGQREYWDRGYGTEAVELLLKYIFSTTQLHRVYLHTLAWNQRARRCFEKCGFLPTGEEPRWGQRFMVMEITRPRWGERQEERAL